MSDHNDPDAPSAALHSLEIIFLVFVGILVMIALAEASTYALVSSRTPFVIMVPLLALIVVQGLRLRKAGAMAEVRYRVGEILRGRNPAFVKLSALTGAFLLVIVTIGIFGHFIGLALFIMLLMFVIAKQRFWLSLAVTAGSLVFIFLIFEYGFNVELYRGMLFRYLAGYKVF